MKPVLLLTLILPAMAAGLRADVLYLNHTSGQPGTQVAADVKLRNERRIVGLQFDLRIPAGQAVPGISLVGEGMEKHRLGSRLVADRLKVVVHSPTNAELPDGDILSIPLTLSPGSPQGGPALKVENLIFTNAAGQTIAGSVYYHPLEVWRQDHFTQAQLGDPEVVGDFKDPDGDGLTNIMEFLFATDPLKKDGKDIATQTLERKTVPGQSGGPVLFSFDFPRAIGTDGVELWIESSADMKTWQRENAVPVRTGVTGGGKELMRISVESNPAALPRRFFRLGVSRAESPEPQPGVASSAAKFTDWITHSFSGEDAGNPAVAGEQADPDRDGLVNLMEYLLGSNPRRSSRAALPGSGLVWDGDLTTAALTFSAGREGKGVFLTVDPSPESQTWVSAAWHESAPDGGFANGGELAASGHGATPAGPFFQFRAARSGMVDGIFPPPTSRP